MTEKQWKTLLSVINGNVVEPIPVGFIIDSPWLPGWAGMTTLDYYTSETKWLEANFKAIETFPDIMFLPGFWAEFGMCTEPSAFGSKCSWAETELPFAHKIITDVAQVADLEKPDASKDGLLPFVVNRLKNCNPRIEKAGHAIRFAIARGPLNIASFLMGTTEFLMGVRINPDVTHKLLSIVTEFIIDWLKLQKQNFPSIDGIFILDDIVGFLGEEDFTKCAKPYLKQIFAAFDASVKFFHNDAAGLVSAPHLADIGINLFNFSSDHTLARMRELVGDKVTLLGNIPPRDVLGAGTPDEVSKAVKASVEGLKSKTRLILSSGGGMPQDVSTENIQAFTFAAEKL